MAQHGVDGQKCSSSAFECDKRDTRQIFVAQRVPSDCGRQAGKQPRPFFDERASWNGLVSSSEELGLVAMTFQAVGAAHGP